MRPRLIEVTNFMGHVSERVALPDSGMFFLSGESGAGKSSFIVDAVGYALFGNKATRYRRQEQLRHKDHQTESMEVRVMFEFDDQSRLTVVRGLNAKANPYAECYEPDPGNPQQQLLLADTPSKVSREVRKRLGGMSPQQFYAAFVARQSEIAMLTSLVGAKRKELVHQLLGMRELERAEDEVNNRKRTARAQLNTLQTSLGDRTRDSEDARVAALQEEAKNAGDRAASTDQQLTALRDELRRAEQALAPLQDAETARQKAAALTESLQSRREAAEQLERAAARHAEAQQLAAALNDLEAEERDLATQLETRRADYQRSAAHAGVAAKRATTARRVDELRRAAAPALVPAGAEAEAEAEPVTAEALRTRAQLLQSEVSRARAEQTDRREELQRLRETGQCTTCLRPLGDGHEHDRVLSSVEDRIAELARVQEDAVAELASIERDLPGVEQRERDQAAASQELAVAESALAALDGELQELSDSGTVFDDLEEAKAAGKELAGLHQAKQQEVAKARTAASDLDAEAPTKLQAARSAITEQERELSLAQQAAGDVSPDDVASGRRRVDELRAQVATAEGQLPEVRRQAEAADRALEGARKDQEALADKLTRAEELSKQVVLLEDLQTYLGGFQRKLAADIRPVLEEMASEMLYQVSGGKHVTMKLDDNYEIEVQTQEGSWLPAAGLSGGESIRVNLCLRLALTRLVSQRTGVPVRYLVLDEPLPSQDPGHVERIMELLDSLRPFYPQIHLISHVGELRTSEQMDFILAFEGEGTKRINLTYA